ncbi:NAD-dependent epimerase/dehydratase family protein [Crateriforma conspicua]|uniref:3 beta-hydroxysteroid dehydrogenase/Delta 5-->4-isomerase n=1 Tax=Crateriforma conspicua TaxID=2527996 RepID=A0A5C5Y7F7_9PLAN|nr:NAD(P)-dependent oxidoreductase [Crateriforma conspicua]TWT70899.1 3 beta-hydroxysteroid dehydrogenase/Delta 5-->4-isomerase [Crateriforma conspicua]
MLACMKIALTGGSGFLGRYVIRHLVDELGHQVVALTRRDDPAPDRQGLHWMQGDLADPASLDRLTDGADAVVHAGLMRGGDSFMDHPDDPVGYFDTNVLGTLRLLQSSTDRGINRLVFVSSGAVHQHVVQGLALDEDHPHRPGSFYGAAKASAEDLVHAYGLSGRLAAATVRPPTIYGVDDPISDSRWYALVKDLVDGKEVAATGGGKCVHAADVAKAIGLVLTAPQSKVAGQTFNCCDRFFSEVEVAQCVQSLGHTSARFTGPAKSAGHPMATEKIRSLGMEFGGTDLLRQTIKQLVQAAEVA